MANTKKNNIYVPLVVAGYALFLLLVLSVFMSTTLPRLSILSYPGAIKINALVAMVSLTIGALLPVVVGYCVGDHSIKSKSKLSHHFNGILFGLLAYWYMILTAAFTAIPSALYIDNNARLILANILPSVGVAIIASVIAVMHVRSKQSKLDVLEYIPFVLLLVLTIITLPLLSVINNFATQSVNLYTFFTPISIVLFALIAYSSIRGLKTSGLYKAAWVAVSLSVLFLTIFVMNLFESAIVSYMGEPSQEIQATGGWVALVATIVGWAVYWLYQTKALRATGVGRTTQSVSSVATASRQTSATCRRVRTTRMTVGSFRVTLTVSRVSPARSARVCCVKGKFMRYHAGRSRNFVAC